MKKIEQKEKTKRNISLALFILLNKCRYEDVTIQMVCHRANVSRMSFYRYFNSLDDIIIDFADERFAEFFDEVIKFKPTTVDELLLGIYYVFKDYAKQILILLHAKKGQILSDQFNSYARYLTSKDRLPNLFLQDLSSETITFISGGIFFLITDWLEEGMKKTPEEMAKITKSILFDN